MKRTKIAVVCVLGFVALCMAGVGTTEDDGMRGFFGRANVIQGIVEIDHGTGTNQPGYQMIESSDGTALFFFADDDGVFRQDTAAPTGNTSGEYLDIIHDVNNVTADLVTFAGSDLYIVDSSGAAVTGTLADGTIVGETVTFACKVAGNNIDIAVEHHVTSDPETIRLDTALENVTLVWDGTDWTEINMTGATYP